MYVYMYAVHVRVYVVHEDCPIRTSILVYMKLNKKLYLRYLYCVSEKLHISVKHEIS